MTELGVAEGERLARLRADAVVVADEVGRGRGVRGGALGRREGKEGGCRGGE